MRVVIEQIREEETVIDPDFGTPVGNIQRTEQFEIQAQINFLRKKNRILTPTKSGDEEKTKGRMLVAKKDLDKSGITLKKGDKIIEAGPEGNALQIDGFIREIRGESPLRGQFLFIVAVFEEDRDKHTVRNSK